MLRRAFSFFSVLLTAFGLGALPILEPIAATRHAHRRRGRGRRSGKYYTPNGVRECARRCRQIELGQLRVSA